MLIYIGYVSFVIIVSDFRNLILFVLMGVLKKVEIYVYELVNEFELIVLK